jgi:Right handed beta helix region
MVIQRTFVSTSGNDSNPGTREAPCRTFQAALALTAPGGEVVALDSGDYAAFVIDKAVTVAAVPEAYAAITVSSGDGVYVRGLRMTTVNAAASLVVRDSVFRANSAGVVVNGSTGGRIRVEIERTRADRNRDNGFWFLGGVRGTVRDAAATDNTNSGFFFQPEAVLTLFDSVADGNGNGVAVMAPGTQVQVTLANVVLANNTSFGVMASPASLMPRIGTHDFPRAE